MKTKKIRVFCSYSHEDESLREKLKKQLATLEREGLIEEWHDRQISAGREWESEISKNLENSDIILLLISADFLASEYVNDVELKRSLERHRDGKARVIPVILRPCDWTSQPFSRLQALPKEGRAIITWDHVDEALTDVVRGLRKVINELLGTKDNAIENGVSSVLPPVSNEKRVQLLYHYETPGGKEWRELPFVIGVIGPLSGERQNSVPLNLRRFIRLDRYNIDDVIQGIRPKLSFLVPNCLVDNDENGKLPIELEFQSLNDFTPDRVARQIAPLHGLLRIRDSCIQLLPRLNRDLEGILKKILADENTISQIVEASSVSTEDGERDFFQGITLVKRADQSHDLLQEGCNVSDVLNSVGCHDQRTKASIATFIWYVGSQNPQLKGNSIERCIKEVLSSIDYILTKQVVCVLRNGSFQALEATWRGLRYLVENLETNNKLVIKVLDVTKEELVDDLQKDRHLKAKIYDQEYKTLSGEPFGVLLGDFSFSHQTQDVALLRNLASLCSIAHVPFIGAANPKMFQLKSFKDLSHSRNLSLLFESPDYDEWNRFRDTPEACFIGLVLPRILARCPYTDRSGSSAKFEVEEMVWKRNYIPSHEEFTWGSTTYLVGVCLGRAFTKFGWCASVSGQQTGGAMSKLLVYEFKAPKGDRYQIGPTEFAATYQMENELADLGFFCLCQRKNSNEATFISLQSCHRPKRKKVGKHTPESFWHPRLQYWLVICRFTQYIGVILYENLQAFDSPQSLASYLQNWLANYVSSSVVSKEAEFRFPLQEATVRVVERNEESSLTVSIRPRLQLHDITGIAPPTFEMNIDINR